jgi:hypothetical protein
MRGRPCGLVGFVALVLLTCPPFAAHAGVSVSIGINLPAPPPLVAVPSSPVLYAPSVDANYFSYGGQLYVFTAGVWYVGPRYDGPWAVVAPAYVPRPLLAVPLRYYRRPPPGWRHWHHDAPPHWKGAWGRSWKEHERAPHEHPRTRHAHGRRGHHEH